MTLATVIAYLSGVGLVAPGLAPSAAAGTGLVVLVCHAILCRVIAHYRGRPLNRWTLLGLIGGIWVVSVLILLPARAPAAAPPAPPP